MFDWLFSKKTEAPKPKVQQGDQIAPGDLWMYDCLSQYLQSPLWSIPLIDFIESNCIYFEDEQENKFEYTKIFDNFRQLVAGMVDSMMAEIGISEQLLEKCIKKGLRSKYHKLFEQILVCDNFLAFKKIMIKKNKELEFQAIKQLQLKDTNFQHYETKVDQMELERMELEKAIAISMAISDKISEQEEKMIQQAIRQSQLQQQKKLQQQFKKAQIEDKPKKLSSLPPLIPIGTTIKEQPIQQLKKQSQQLEKQTIKAREQQQKQAQERASKVHVEAQKQKEDSEQRKKRLIEQRELLRKKKQQERTTELKQFVEGKQQVQKQQSKVSEEELQRRRNLMKKLKQQLQ